MRNFAATPPPGVEFDYSAATIPLIDRLRLLVPVTLAVGLAGAPAQAAPRPAAKATPDAQAVRTWLTALAATDPRTLAEASTLPFTFATNYKWKKCDGTANDEKAQQKTFKCLFSNEKILIGELKYADENTVIQGAEPQGAEAIKDVPRQLREVVKKLGTAGEQVLVGGYLNGDGIVFQFVFALRPVAGKLKVSGLAMDFAAHE
jgi:hypothetical protein